MLRILVKKMLRVLGLMGPAQRARDRMEVLRHAGVNRRYLQARRAAADDPVPVPPAALIQSVTGNPDLQGFLESGKRGAESIESALQAAGLRITDMRRILDFGCGCGRVLRYWSKERLPQTEVFGTDINARSIRWCGDSLRFAAFETCGPQPPLPYPDSHFDLAYALSVFTHMPEDLQVAWIGEMARVLSPGGHLLITTHGVPYLKALSPEEAAAFLAGNVVLKREGPVGSNRFGAYHPREYVERRLAADFHLVYYEEAGARGNPVQDLYLFRK